MSAPSDKEVQALLDRLCIDLGFCLSPVDRQRLAEHPPGDPLAFTNEVFRAEGLALEDAPPELFRRVRSVVLAAYRLAEDGRGG